MSQLHCHYHTLSSNIFFSLSNHHHHHLFLSLPKPTNSFSLSAIPRPKLDQSRLSQLPEPTDTNTSTAITTPEEDEGPTELPPSLPSILATNDEPTSLQVATSVLLTGAITVFLFRSLRRRAKRAKELKLRSSGAKKTLKEEALDNLKAMGSTTIDTKKPPSPVQALLGGISAGVIALILYKFTTTIEAALNRQTISDNFSVRQITITIRTIVNGLCYLATFVFGLNSIGLFLYSGQLALNAFMGDSDSEESENKGSGQLGSTNSTSDNPTDSAELSSGQIDNKENKQ